MAVTIWDKALSLIEIDPGINAVVFDTLIKNMKLVKEDTGFVILSCKDDYSLNSIKNSATITSSINNALNAVSGKKINISYVKEGDENAITTATIAEKKSSSKNMERDGSEKSILNPDYTFEKFIVGDCNRFAQAASIRVSEKPGQKQFNPLYIYGNPGLGKTHLIQAIGHRLVNNFPNKRVVYRTCEQFTNEYINCIKKNNYDSFRSIFRNADVLMIDDIQFLIGKESVQEEFFNTFETLINSGNQIVLTCDKAPSKLVQLDERLTSRFQNGYTMDIQPPDFATRKAILISKLEEYKDYKGNIRVDDEVINYICENVTSNIRVLNGACNILTTQMALLPDIDKIDLETAKDLLRTYISPQNALQITPELILSSVSQYYDITLDKIKSKSRSRDIIIPRYVAIYMMREYIDIPLKKIGEYFGGRDHTTVINAISKVEKDEKLMSDVDKIRRSLQI